ncbi:hypothetical protein RND71_027648 [Anisodus tanguticus]|uniref:MRG domain-containing protein n=1 Tax=Anisodus tanguticus TaxID=243964 RepID=A0AAE1RH08_9SOLA|nr:hypothetical protein RND71_027648 [Anisodus tanguticus]
MGSSNGAGVTEDSTTVSDDAHDTDIDMADIEAEAIDSPRFQEGEKVLAFHSQQLYEAKVQKAEFQMRELRYFVHYLDKDGPPPEKLVNVQIPPQLKKQLIDDSEFVNHLGKLIRLPHSQNVDEILEKYRDYRLKKDGEIPDSVGETISGLKCYFNKALPAMLLYKNEREQFQELI